MPLNIGVPARGRRLGRGVDELAGRLARQGEHLGPRALTTPDLLHDRLVKGGLVDHEGARVVEPDEPALMERVGHGPRRERG